MMNKYSIKQEGVTYSVKVTEKSNSWGKGVKLTIYRSNGERLNSISYLCHPEFDKYDKCQNLPISELEKIALSRVTEDIGSDDFKLAAESGTGLLLPLNNYEKT